MQLTSVGFYHLTVTPLERALPLILEKILAQGKRALVMGESEEYIEELCHRLWTYTPLGFLPHGTRRDGYPEEQPIWLTEREENPNKAEVLLTVAPLFPSHFDQFDRWLIFFREEDTPSLEHARSLWSQLAAQNIPLIYWKQDEGGKWEKARESSPPSGRVEGGLS